jgi:hypothetical protein
MTEISKYLEVNRRVDLLKILLAYILIIIAAFSPVAIAFVGAEIESVIKGHPVHEGNSGIMAIGWLVLLTFPGGIILIVICTAIYIKNVFIFIKGK